MSQDETIDWATKLKETDPMSLKELYQERDDFKNQVAAKDQSIAELTKQLAELKANSVKIPVEKNETDVSSAGYDRQNANSDGVVFKVQIGAFRNKDLTKYFENNKNFSGDVDSDGTKKYTLGYFSDYWEGDRFKKYLREMGVKDAWIVPYKAGKRLNIKDVLEGIIE
jgi:hypothetical protein